MGKVTDLTGQHFGRLTVLRMATPKMNEKGNRLPPEWECICDCGTALTVASRLLLGRHKQSCGCLRKENVQNPAARKQMHLQLLEAERLWGPCPYPVFGCSRNKAGWCCDDCDMETCKRRCANVPEKCGCKRLKG